MTTPSEKAPAPQRTAERPARGGALRALWRWSKRLAMAATLLALAAAATLFGLVRHYEQGLPSVGELQGGYRPPQTTRVLARDGTLLAELYTERRTVVPIESLPNEVKLAVLAAEDARFYEHQGLNYLGMVRALVVNLRSGRTRQGASTITQQVVKNTLLDAERSYRRKAREVILARRLEQELSKDKILELYLNQIYFGHGRFGIEEAARYYFGCPARKLSLSQGALLAGLIASPETYSPRHAPDRAASRRRFVLDQMRDKGFISAAVRDRALAEPLQVAPAVEAHAELAPEAVEIAKRVLRKTLGDAAALGGYTVTTTIDPRLQAAARKALRDNLLAYDKRHGLQGPFAAPETPARKPKHGKHAPRAFEGTPRFAEHKVLLGEVTGADDAAGLLHVRVGTVQGSVRLSDFERYNPKSLAPSAFARPGALLRVSLAASEPENPAAPGAPRVPLRLELGPESALVAIDVRTREVLALVGNYEAAAGGLDRATQARRQPGSTFKPIVYSYALHSRRVTAATLVETRPGTIGGYRPMNFEEADGTAPMRLREALAQSVNVAAVHVAQLVGPTNIVPWARALGISGTLGADLSLALGSYEVSPVEMANAYTTFAAAGSFEPHKLVTRILDSAGREVPLAPNPPSRRVMEDNEAYLITSLLGSVVDHGTGAKAKAVGRPVAGKTGTSNDAKDAWFVGYSTDIACAAWVGFDDAAPLGAREAGSTAALPVWVAFMRAAHEGRPTTDFPRPADIVTVRIDPASGLRAWEGQEGALDEIFLPGTEPTMVAQPDAGPDADGGATEAAAAASEADALALPAVEREAGTLPALPVPEGTVPLF
jgi:penicillin-binding protein 1A